jgi:hypothetical protein
MGEHRQEGNAIRGLYYGALISLPIWFLIAFVVWFIWFRG